MMNEMRPQDLDREAPDVRILLPLARLLARLTAQEMIVPEPQRGPATPFHVEMDIFSKKAWNARDLAQITGFSSRYWTGKAAAGEVPGAVQVAGNGGKWSFDPKRFMAWWKSHEVRPPEVPDIKRGPSPQRHSPASNRLATLLGLD